MLKKIISGGQTGADQGALHGARLAGLETGGTAPKGYRTELGPNPDLLKRYNLTESQNYTYPSRTLQNILDSDATLLIGDPTSAGSAMTIEMCKKHGKAYAMLSLAEVSAMLSLGEVREDTIVHKVASWLRVDKITTLNVAGNRESKNPGIHAATSNFIVRLVAELEKDYAI